MSKTTLAAAGVTQGIIAGAAPDGRPLLRWGHDTQAATPATAAWLPQRIDWAACRGVRVLVGFLEGDEERPVLLGLLEEPPPAAITAAERRQPPQEDNPRTLRLQGQEEVVIECGKARIQLRADGTVIIRGERILSRSKGVNRVKGGSVQIN